MRGRDFSKTDDADSPRVAIVNETFAKRLLAGREPIGSRFNFDGPDKPYWEVIGVAADGKYNSLGEDPKPAFYRPLFRNYSTNASLVARTNSNDSQAAIAGLQNELRHLDPTLPVFHVTTLSEHMSLPLFPFRLAAIVLGSFGVLAVILAAIGIYGVMSYVVASRTREVGVRVALGAARSNVLFLIMRQGMSLALVGVVLGLLAAFGAAQLLVKVLFGVS